MNGTFDAALDGTARLSFALNTTGGQQAMLVAREDEWLFPDAAPGLTLFDESGADVLRTAVTKRGDCTQLKVCVAGPPGRSAAAVQPEVLAPLGLILMRQINYAAYVTQPPTTS